MTVRELKTLYNSRPSGARLPEEIKEYLINNVSKKTRVAMATDVGMKFQQVSKFLRKRGLGGKWNRPISPSTIKSLIDNRMKYSNAELSRKFGVRLSTIGNIFYRKGLRGGFGGGPRITSVKKLAMMRDGHVCVICGYDTNIDLHHIDHNRKNNVIDNLITLCPNHHREAHKGFISIDGPSLKHIWPGIRAA